MTEVSKRILWVRAGGLCSIEAADDRSLSVEANQIPINLLARLPTSLARVSKRVRGLNWQRRVSTDARRITSYCCVSYLSRDC